ncbi:MAG: hypothetical protein MUC36_25915 [Planctomycetes bacterium]|jgi:hypothetical protein|nr:hypothetical protein [Planctomycetota bacterium]
MSQSSHRQVLDHEASWNPARNLGRVLLHVRERSKPLLIRCDDAAEFAAIVTLLRGSKPVFSTDEGWLTTQATGPIEA